jgi:hypothetical protein
MKTLVDQIFFSPLFLGVYLVVKKKLNSTKEKKITWDMIKKQLRTEFPSILLANYKLWPLVSLVAYRFVPPKLIVLFGNVVAIF